MKKAFNLAVALLVLASLHAGLSKAGMLSNSKLNGPATGTLFAVFENPRDLTPAFSESDVFLKQDFSVGEATPIHNDPTQTWRAGQARVWVDLPAALNSARLFVQSGLGFLRSDPFSQSYGFFATPAFMIPFGLGMDAMTNSGLRLTAMLMFDVTQTLHPAVSSTTQVSQGLLLRIGF